MSRKVTVKKEATTAASHNGVGVQNPVEIKIRLESHIAEFFYELYELDDSPKKKKSYHKSIEHFLLKMHNANVKQPGVVKRFLHNPAILEQSITHDNLLASATLSWFVLGRGFWQPAHTLASRELENPDTNDYPLTSASLRLCVAFCQLEAANDCEIECFERGQFSELTTAVQAVDDARTNLEALKQISDPRRLFKLRIDYASACERAIRARLLAETSMQNLPKLELKTTSIIASREELVRAFPSFWRDKIASRVDELLSSEDAAAGLVKTLLQSSIESLKDCIHTEAVWRFACNDPDLLMLSATNGWSQNLKQMRPEGSSHAKDYQSLRAALDSEK